jgi:hypothetical protein
MLSAISSSTYQWADVELVIPSPTIKISGFMQLYPQKIYFTRFFKNFQKNKSSAPPGIKHEEVFCFTTTNYPRDSR